MLDISREIIMRGCEWSSLFELEVVMVVMTGTMQKHGRVFCSPRTTKQTLWHVLGLGGGIGPDRSPQACLPPIMSTYTRSTVCRLRTFRGR